jgi:hypothetical protein
MIKHIFFAAVALLLCSSCVSRTTYKTTMDGQEGKQVVEKQDTVWFWEKDF